MQSQRAETPRNGVSATASTSNLGASGAGGATATAGPTASSSSLLSEKKTERKIKRGIDEEMTQSVGGTAGPSVASLAAGINSDGTVIEAPAEAPQLSGAALFTQNAALRLAGFVLFAYIVGYLGFSALWLAPFVLLMVHMEKNVSSIAAGEARKKALSEAPEDWISRRNVSQFQRLAGMKFPDRETVEWLNAIISKAWEFHEGWISTSIVAALLPKLNELKIPSVMGFEFSKFSLGKLPPVFLMVKLIPSKFANRHEFILDIDFKYLSDANIVLKVKVGSKLLPIPLDIQVSDVKFDGTLRLEMTFQANAPYIKTMKFSFVDQPMVSFDLRPITRLIDIMSLPLLEGMIKNVVNGSIKWAMVWPTKIIIPYNDWYGVPDNNTDGNSANGLLIVEVLEARNLIAADTNGASDPYVVVKYGEKDMRKTRVVKRSLNPLWHDERFTFRSAGNLEMKKVSFEVFDWEKLALINAADRLGEVDVALSEVVECDGYLLDAWKPLKGVKHGELHMRVQFVPLVTKDETGEGGADGDDDVVVATDGTTRRLEDSELPRQGSLEIRILRAENLVAADSNGKSDPYVEVYLGKNKFKTSVIPKTLNPEWNADFLADVTDVFNQEAAFHVFDHDNIGRDDKIGEYDFPLREVSRKAGRPIEKVFELKKVAHGKLFVEFTWMPTDDRSLKDAISKDQRARRGTVDDGYLSKDEGTGAAGGSTSNLASGTPGLGAVGGGSSTAAGTPNMSFGGASGAAGNNSTMSPMLGRAQTPGYDSPSPGTTGSLTPLSARAVPAANAGGQVVLGSKGAQKTALISAISANAYNIKFVSWSRATVLNKDRMYFIFHVVLNLPPQTPDGPRELISWEIWRRYTQFHHLQEMCREVRPKIVVPSLPDKGRFARHDDAFLSQRATALETFILHLLAVPGIVKLAPTVVDFLIEGKEYSPRSDSRK